MITITEFIQKLEEEFDDIEQNSLTPSTNYRSIENWGSMHALIIIALVDTEFDVSLSGADLKNTQTIQDLYDLVVSKK
ncbi:MAG: acyl carrier protein [Flavobacteriales bacterium]|nr:acyl carrier protein [Flavobacteriales bacterium]